MNPAIGTFGTTTLRQTTMGGTTIIEVENLSKRYGDKLAVDGLSFAVQPGIVTGFLGPNGAASPQPCD